MFFDASQAQYHGIYGVFCSWYQEPRYLQCFVAGTLQKQWYLRNFQNVARNTFSMPKAEKHCKLQCFGFWHPMKNAEKRLKNSQKCPKWSFSFNLQKRCKWHLVSLSSPQAGSGLTFPKRVDSEPPPPTPRKLASLRFASLIPILSPRLRLAVVKFFYITLNSFTINLETPSSFNPKLL